MTGTLKDFFDGKYGEVQALGTLDDTKVYNMEDYVELNKLDDQVRKNGLQPLGNHIRVPNVDKQGFLKSTPRERLVANPSIAFINRIKVNKTKKTIAIVIDYRACTEQAQGSIYAPTVLAYIVGKVADEKGESRYAVQSVETVAEQSFINDFKDTLTEADAKLMYEVITHYKNTGTSTGISLDDLF